jgi:hypothetical protein
MSAPFNRTALTRGPAKVTIGGATLYMRGDFSTKHAPVFNPVMSSLHGQSDKYKKDLVIKLNLTLFGLWQDLTVLFPSYAMNPTVGTDITGSTDQAVVVHARNGDRITYTNGWITKLLNLFLGVDGELFAAAVEITCVIGKDKMPTDAGAYFVRDSTAYTETAFAMTNFNKGRWSGVWGAVTGFGAIATHKGFNIDWNLAIFGDGGDGYGTQSLIIDDAGLVGNCKCIPIGPTLAQGDTAQGIASRDIGSLLSTGAADLTLSGPNSAAVVLKNANIIEHATTFGVKPLRAGEVAWETTRVFTAGVPSAVGTVA